MSCSKFPVPSQGYCFMCSKKTSKKCGACDEGNAIQVPFYCSDECQINDWPRHEVTCAKKNKGRGWRLEEEPVVHEITGKIVERRFFATKNLKAGHFLFSRKTLLAFPSIPDKKEKDEFLSTDGSQDTEVHMRALTCICCFESLAYGEVTENSFGDLIASKCLSCGWPLHSNLKANGGVISFTPCQEAHADECEILCKNGLFWSEVGTLPQIFYCLGLLRAVLLPQEQKEELLSYPVALPQFAEMFKILDAMKDFVTDKCKIDAPQEELDKLLVAIFGNVLSPRGMYSRYVEMRRKMAHMIFEGGPTGRVLTHNCTPNCALYLDRNLQVTFRTIRNVEKGDVLSMNYFGSDPYFWCRLVSERAIMLNTMLVSRCKCVRCNQGVSSEGGTMFSVFKCPTRHSCAGNCKYINPFPNLDAGDISDIFFWTCGCSIFDAVMTQAEVEDAADFCRKLLNVAGDASQPYESLKKVLNKISGTVHPNNAVVVFGQLKIAAVVCDKIIGQVTANKKRLDLHDKYMGDINLALQKLAQVQPGWTEHYGLFNYCLGLLRMTELADRVTKNKKNWNPKRLDNELDDILRRMYEGWTVMHLNPLIDPFATTAEEQMARFYGNHLDSKLKKAFGGVINNLKSVQTLRKRYCIPVNFIMSDEEREFRTMIIHPPEQFPELLANFLIDSATTELDALAINDIQVIQEEDAEEAVN